MVYAKAIACVAVLVVCTCISPNTVRLADLHKEYGLSSLPVQADYPEDDAVILIESAELELPEPNSTTRAHVLRYRRAVRVFRPSEQFSTVTFSLPAEAQITNISARTVTRAGDVVDLAQDEFHTYTNTSDAGGTGSGIRVVTFAFRSVDSGSVLEYQYQMLSSVPRQVTRWNMQYEIPAVRLQYSFQLPAIWVAPKSQGGFGIPLTFRTYNNDRDIVPSERQIDEKTVEYVFDVVNVPAYRPPLSSVPGVGSRRYTLVQFGEFATWDDVGTWYYNRFFKPQFVHSTGLKAETARLTSGAESKSERTQALYDYVRAMRYIEIGMEQGGLLPSLPQDVLERQYGDCKDKSTLLVSMLASAGVKASPVLMLTRDAGVVEKDWPAMRFNHMIVLADLGTGNWAWLDPTARFHTMGSLPWQCQAVQALAISPEGKYRLVETPSPPGRANAVNTHTNVRIDGDSVVYYIRSRLHGESCAEMRYRLAGMLRRQHADMFRWMLDDGLSTAVIRGHSSRVEKGDTTMLVEVELVQSRTESLQDRMLFIPVVPLDMSDLRQWAVPETRNEPVFLKYRRCFNDTLTVSYANSDYSVLSKPPSRKPNPRSPVAFSCRNAPYADGHSVVTELRCENREIPR